MRATYDQVAGRFVAALGDVARDGDTADRACVEATLAHHHDYLQAIDRLFRATDRGDTAGALKIDGGEVDPSFGAIEQAVLGAADARHALALAELGRLQRLEGMTRMLTPMVFLLGLGQAALLMSAMRGHRRQLAAERAKALHASLHDALTGLPNRTLLADRFGQALRADARAGTTTGLLLIDLDRFKEINDTFGHHYGDELLRQVGPRLTAALREVDTVARLGGDEFAVLLPDVSSVHDGLAVAGTLRAALETPFQVEGVDLDVEASIGVVRSSEHGTDPTVPAAARRHRDVRRQDPTARGVRLRPRRRRALPGQTRPARRPAPGTGTRRAHPALPAQDQHQHRRRRQRRALVRWQHHTFRHHDPTRESIDVWAGKELLRHLLAQIDGGARPYKIRERLDLFYSHAARAAIPELTRLATTHRDLVARGRGVPELRVTNARTEGYNTNIKLIKRTARGFRSQANYQRRILLANAAAAA